MSKTATNSLNHNILHQLKNPNKYKKQKGLKKNLKEFTF